MFKRLETAGTRPVHFTFEGTALAGVEGDSVASALLAAGHAVFRHTPVSASARGPLCMMGVCHDCLVSIDGGASVQACLTPLREGMQVRQPALPASAPAGEA